MSQTQLDYNQIMSGAPGEVFRYKTVTITGAADLVAGTILVGNDAGQYRAAVDADKVSVGAAAIDAGWVVLLEAAAVTGGNVDKKVGISGGAYIDKLVGVGLTIDDLVYNKLAMNNIKVQNGSDSVAVAGE